MKAIQKTIQWHKAEIHRLEKMLEEINKPPSKEPYRIVSNKFPKETELLKTMLGEKYVAVISNNRKYPIAALRQVAIHYFCENTNLDLKDIGVIFGYRDHSSIIHSRNKVNELKETDYLIQSAIELINNNLNK